MKTLVFTTVYPNDAQPVHGLFVAQQIRQVASHEEVRVVAPIPWRRAQWAMASASSRPADANVQHPTFYYLPGLFKSLDWLFLALSSVPAIMRLRRTFDFDLVDAHFGYPDGVAAAFLGWWFKRPV